MGMIMVYATAAVSGGHLNPAVSLGFRVTGRMGTNRFVAYVCAQIFGAILASFLLKFLLGSSVVFTTTGSLTATRPMIVFLWEFFGTFALTYVVFATAVTENAGTAAPLAIGLTLAADIFAMGRFTGGSMNPAPPWARPSPSGRAPTSGCT